MGRKRKNISNDDDWENCPACGRLVKSKNLNRHLNKMHSSMSKKELKEKAKNRRINKRGSNLNKAEIRKEMERERERKNAIIAIALIFIFVVVIVAGYYLVTASDSGFNSNLDTTPQPVNQAPPPTAKNEVRIPLVDVNDGKAHYYSYDSDGITIRYFVLKSSDGVTRAAFDACDVCYDAKRGYRQEGDNMVCNNCGQRFASVKINEEKGGCNPAPLDRTVDGSDLVIKLDDIEAGRWYFA